LCRVRGSGEADGILNYINCMTRKIWLSILKWTDSGGTLYEWILIGQLKEVGTRPERKKRSWNI
jgi:hypothetical protein